MKTIQVPVARNIKRRPNFVFRCVHIGSIKKEISDSS